MITEIIRYIIQPNTATLFEKAYTDAAKILHDSSHCLGYELLHGAEEPENWLLIIRWASADAHLKGFRQAPEFSEFFRLVKPFFAEIQEMKHYESTRLILSKSK